jgi:hypothetical protein
MPLIGSSTPARCSKGRLVAMRLEAVMRRAVVRWGAAAEALALRGAAAGETHVHAHVSRILHGDAEQLQLAPLRKLREREGAAVVRMPHVC